MNKFFENQLHKLINDELTKHSIPLHTPFEDIDLFYSMFLYVKNPSYFKDHLKILKFSNNLAFSFNCKTPVMLMKNECSYANINDLIEGIAEKCAKNENHDFPLVNVFRPFVDIFTEYFEWQIENEDIPLDSKVKLNAQKVKDFLKIEKLKKFETFFGISDLDEILEYIEVDYNYDIDNSNLLIFEGDNYDYEGGEHPILIGISKLFIQYIFSEFNFEIVQYINLHPNFDFEGYFEKANKHIEYIKNADYTHNNVDKWWNREFEYLK